MIYDFFDSMSCVFQEEVSDYRGILDSWRGRNYHVAFMPAIHWHGGTLNLFEQKARNDGKNMIWIVPAGQKEFWWFPTLKKNVESFYQDDEIDVWDRSFFPEIEAEEFEECILLHSKELQNSPERTILGANVLLVRLSLSSGRDTIMFILLDHQDNCWQKIIENYNIKLSWLVDSGRGMGDYFVWVNLYQLMKNTSKPELLPKLYFKGLYNKGEIPEGFQFRYAMFSDPDENGYDQWRLFSSVYDANW